MLLYIGIVVTGGNGFIKYGIWLLYIVFGMIPNLYIIFGMIVNLSRKGFGSHIQLWLVRGEPKSCLISDKCKHKVREETTINTF